MLRSNKGFQRFFRNQSIAWKLTLLNAVLLALVIWITGISVKDFACILFGNLEPVDSNRRDFFNKTMDIYLLRSISLALVLYALFYLYIFKKMLKPLRELTASTRQMINGDYPKPLPIRSNDEIGSLTSDFNELVARLQSIEQQRKKMVTDIAHELRTPLTNINGYLEALHSGVIKGDTAMYHSLYEESQRLTRLVEQLHDLNVIEANEKNVKDTDMLLLMTSVLKSFELELKDKKIRLNVDMEPVSLKSNEDMLIQVIVNLVKNAMLYNINDWVTVTGKKNENMYRVLFTNEGTALSDEERSQLFERFYRAEPSRNRTTGGAGLGLAIVKEYIERLGGKVGVTYSDHMYTFWFELPIDNNR